MNCQLYTSSVFLTLKNKLALLKSFIQTTKLPACKTALLAISEEFKNKIDQTTNKINELGEKFTSSLEEINNNLNAEFKKQAQILLSQEKNSKLTVSNKQNSEEIEKELLTYNKNKFSSNRIWRHDCQNSVYAVFKQIKSHIKSLIEYNSSRKTSKSNKNKRNKIDIDNVNKKIELLEIIFNDIPKLGFNEYEIITITNTMKKALKQSRQINSNIKAAQTITFEEVSNFDMEKIQQKTRIQQIHTSNPNKKRTNKTLDNFPGHTQNYEEYEKILKACNYIAEELAEIKNNQFTIESLITDFFKKDEILKNFKKNTSTISEYAGPRIKRSKIKSKNDWSNPPPEWHEEYNENSSGFHHAKRKKLRKCPQIFDWSFWPELGDPHNWSKEYLAEEIIFCDVKMSRNVARNVCFAAYISKKNVYNWEMVEMLAKAIKVTGRDFIAEYIEDYEIARAYKFNDKVSLYTNLKRFGRKCAKYFGIDEKESEKVFKTIWEKSC